MKHLIGSVICRILGIFGKEPGEDALENMVQFVLFGIVGASNTMISYLINVAALLVLRPRGLAWDYVAANLLAFFLSVLWSFYWNNKAVFTLKEGERRNPWKALLKAYASYGLTGIVLNNILSWLWIAVFDISKFIAPLINLIASVPLNFVVQKLWTFKGERWAEK